jgi:hypothetical protein
MARVITIDIGGIPVDGTRVGPFNWIAMGRELVEFTAMAGVEQQRFDVGSGIDAVGSAGTDLLVSAGDGILQFREPGAVPTPLDVGEGAFLVGGDQVVWVVDGGQARRIREHRLDPAIEADVVMAAVVGDELWWVDAESGVRSSATQKLAFKIAGKPSAMVGCAGSLWMAHQGRLYAKAIFEDGKDAQIDSPIGEVDHLLCVDGVLVGASARQVFFRYPMGPAVPQVVDHEFTANIVGLLPGPELFWVLTESTEAVVVRLQ